MVRVLLRESGLIVLGLFASSVLVFALFDSLADPDWTDAARHAPRLAMAPAVLRGEALPRFYEAKPRDAALRTDDDLAALARDPADPGARGRLVHRGSAALPTLLAHTPASPAAVQRVVYGLLADTAPRLTGGESAPREPEAARRWWSHFIEAHGLDFRSGYAQRQADRLLEHDSPNAHERLTRIGAFALPALASALERSLGDPNASAAGVTRLLALAETLSGHTLAPHDRDDAPEATRAFLAWWSIEHLEYDTLSPWNRSLARVFETRYGRWLLRALSGQFGRSAVTGTLVGREAARRLPASALASGLGGLLATAFVLGFGGNAALRRRPRAQKVTDFVGALVPGSAAFVIAWSALARACARALAEPSLLAELLRPGHVVRMVLGAGVVGAVAGIWMQRPRASAALHVVRVDAERWALQASTPTLRQRLVHGLRIGLASVLVPLGFAGPVVLLGSLVVEWLLGVEGMGALTIQSLARFDGPWTLVASLTVVPLLFGRRWAAGTLFLVLGARPEGEPETAPEAVAARAPETAVTPHEAPP